jgi:hypothetical protein
MGRLEINKLMERYIGSSGGYEFQKGNRYLVYAHAQEKTMTLGVHLCSRTSTVKEAESNGDFKALGEGKAPSSER